MPATAAIILSVLTPLLGLTAALTLFYGSLAFPSEQETWDGISPAAISHKRKQWVMKWIGIPSAVLAASLQIALILWAPA